MDIALTLLAKINISVEDEESYEEQRDEIIQSLEDKGFIVSVESESSDDFDEDFYIDDFDDDDDEEDDEW